ncbi:MAG: phosphate acyltransferase [Gammaproteobacteria bacterium]|nr:MAG: phosphate acyltransferase [Gammaproteobacteria bacterium]PIE36611.1 MAG: phosphate acyltransferase [Gammaproteobacteria bacterium]
MSTIVAIDVMSGDGGMSVAIAAAVDVLAARPDADALSLVLVGDAEAIEAELARMSSDKRLAGIRDRLSIVHADEVVTMEDSARVALKDKKRSSMRMAINLVKDGQAVACVSAGNTGALMAIGKFVLKTVKGIERPAIATSMPSTGSPRLMLDLGANVDSSSNQLHQFAQMGSILARALGYARSPRVGLLNIGSEALKGNDQVRQAAPLLEQCSEINYIGFVEGDDIYTGEVDVVVCDGFAGNVALKASEGLANMIGQLLREEFMRTPLTKLIGLIARPVLKSLRARIDPRQYNGASLVGLRGIVVKSHGGADAFAFAHAIDIAVRSAQLDVPKLIAQQLEQQAAA